MTKSSNQKSDEAQEISASPLEEPLDVESIPIQEAAYQVVDGKVMPINLVSKIEEPLDVDKPGPPAIAAYQVVDGKVMPINLIEPSPPSIRTIIPMALGSLTRNIRQILHDLGPH